MALLSGGLSLAGGAIQMRASPESLRLPLDGNDAAFYYGISAMMGRLDWPWTWNPAAGYPHGMDLAHFPMPELRMWGLLRLITTATSDPIVALNVYFLIGFALVGAASFLLFHVTIRTQWLALALAVAVATVPWHVDRFRHIPLADYSAIPLGLLLACLMWRGWWRRGNGRLLLALSAAAWIGSGGVYYAAYSLLALVPVLLWRMWTSWRDRSWLRDLLVTVTVPATVACCLVVFQSMARTAATGVVFQRRPEESLLFAGDIASLLLPWPWLDPSPTRPARYVEGYALYGLLGVLALLATFATLAWYLWVIRPGSSERPDTAHEVAPWLRMFVWMLAWFAPGLQLVFAYAVSPSLRSWGRVSIVLLYIGTVVLGIIARRWLAMGGPRRTVALASALGLLLGGQVLVDHRPLLESWTAEGLAAGQGYAAQVSATLPARCPVLQVPLLPFPEGFPPPTPEVGIYDHIWLHVLAPDRPWSFGAVRGTSGGDLAEERFPRGLGESEVVARAAADGFCAISIDLPALTQDELDAYTWLLGEPQVQVGRWRLHVLEPRVAP